MEGTKWGMTVSVDELEEIARVIEKDGRKTVKQLLGFVFSGVINSVYVNYYGLDDTDANLEASRRDRENWSGLVEKAFSEKASFDDVLLNVDVALAGMARSPEIWSEVRMYYNAAVAESVGVGAAFEDGMSVPEVAVTVARGRVDLDNRAHQETANRYAEMLLRDVARDLGRFYYSPTLFREACRGAADIGMTLEDVFNDQKHDIREVVPKGVAETARNKWIAMMRYRGIAEHYEALGSVKTLNETSEISSRAGEEEEVTAHHNNVTIGGLKMPNIIDEAELKRSVTKLSQDASRFKGMLPAEQQKTVDEFYAAAGADKEIYVPTMIDVAGKIASQFRTPQAMKNCLVYSLRNNYDFDSFVNFAKKEALFVGQDDKVLEGARDTYNIVASFGASMPRLSGAYKTFNAGLKDNAVSAIERSGFGAVEDVLEILGDKFTPKLTLRNLIEICANEAVPAMDFKETLEGMGSLKYLSDREFSGLLISYGSLVEARFGQKEVAIEQGAAGELTAGQAMVALKTWLHDRVPDNMKGMVTKVLNEHQEANNPVRNLLKDLTGRCKMPYLDPAHRDHVVAMWETIVPEPVVEKKFEPGADNITQDKTRFVEILQGNVAHPDVIIPLVHSVIRDAELFAQSGEYDALIDRVQQATSINTEDGRIGAYDTRCIRAGLRGLHREVLLAVEEELGQEKAEDRAAVAGALASFDEGRIAEHEGKWQDRVRAIASSAGGRA